MSNFLHVLPNSYSDFVLITKEERELSCHKSVLANASVIIAAFLKTGVGENKDKYDLEKYDYEIVDYMITWIYDLPNIECPDEFQFLKLLDNLQIEHDRVAILRNYFDSLYTHEIFYFIKKGQLIDDLWNYSEIISDKNTYKSLLIKVFSPWNKIKKYLKDEITDQLYESKPMRQYYISFCIIYYILIYRFPLPENVKENRKFKIVMSMITYYSVTRGKLLLPKDRILDVFITKITESKLLTTNIFSDQEKINYGSGLFKLYLQFESLLDKSK